jgi:hypothetical protein
MTHYPSESVKRFDQQFAESPEERNERQRARRQQANLEVLWKLIEDLSVCLTDEGPDFTDQWLPDLRRRTANALPLHRCPDWLRQYRDPPLVQS